MKRIDSSAPREPVSAADLSGMTGETVTLHGMVQRIRRLGWGAFIVLRRHDGMVQCVMGSERNEEVLESLSEEQAVRVTGTVKEARIKDASIHPRDAELGVESLEIIHRPAERAPVDLTKKLLDLHIDTNLDLRPLSLRHPLERARLRVASVLGELFSDFLRRSGFTEIHTPKICSAGAEGGANIFSVDYFGEKAFLAQSPQFYKQMGVAVWERVFEVGPVFRAEPHQTTRHINEYTSLDFEMGFIDGQEDVMQLEAAFLRWAFPRLEEVCAYELELLGADVPEIPDSIPCLTLAEAHAMAGDELDRDFSGEPDLEPAEERALCSRLEEETGSGFVFVTHFPSEKRPFYAMDDPDDPGLTLSFDLLFRGLEVTTGGQRIHDYAAQVEKMERFGLDPGDFAGYLQAHRFGLPPHGGLAIGLERLAARLLQLDNIRLTTMFPRDVKRLTP